MQAMTLIERQKCLQRGKKPEKGYMARSLWQTGA
jgi:hypothetical protein